MQISTDRSSQQGFTFVEVVVALIIFSVAVSWAVPSYRAATANADLRGVTMDMVTLINNARAEAVNTRNDVVLSSLGGDGDWGDDGWRMVHPREGNIDYSTRGTVTVKETNDVDEAIFRPDGLIVDGAGNPLTLEFRICDDRDSENGRRVMVNRFGRIENTTPDDKAGC
ncbi:pilus biogenesis protein [Alcanivorax sp. S71-1-4]|uniref:GspH/FimT family pseudopilin n=1 Tax=Alcanivorax sp. S71-1-4 TaxID=1177159 RepID=UPI00135BB762|nr:GspH/FimT family pseudopilin [Alcanivorax sp. S71-1-4]KAF0806622.1 pilus biogenesis protein [Alcanivorax sp. S71-1-4]